MMGKVLIPLLLILSPFCNAQLAGTTGPDLESGDSFIGGGVVGEADDRFIDSSAAAGGDGSFASPWNELSDVTGMTTGDDLYLKTNSVFEDQTINITWNGTATDKVVVATYCVRDDVGIRWASGAVGCGEKAEINGTLEQACRDANPWTCDIQNSNAVPTSQYDYLVRISSDYVTVDALKLFDSAGRTIGGSANQMSSGDTIMSAPRIERVHTQYSAFAGLILERNIDNAQIRDNVFEATAFCERQSQAGQPSPNPGTDLGNCYNSAGSPAGGQPGCTGIVAADDSYSIFENNVVVNGRCEGFSTNDSTHIAVFGNRFAGTGITINMDESNNNVIARNISLGNPDDGDRYSNANQHGIQMSLETTNDDGGFNIVVNNMLGGGENGIYFNSISAEAIALGYGQGGYIYGNTAIGQTLYAMRVAPGDPNAIKHLWLVNNVFQSAETGIEDCRINTGPTDLNTYNLYTSTPADADCTTGTVLTGDALFPYTQAQYAAFDDNDILTLTYDDFLPSGSGAAANSGSLPLSVPSWVSTLLSDTGWNNITVEGGGISACGIGMPSSLVDDADCVTRDATPNVGALEN